MITYNQSIYISPTHYLRTRRKVKFYREETSTGIYHMNHMLSYYDQYSGKLISHIS